MGAEPTLELIARNIEVGQIYKFPEFVRQLSCKRGNTSTQSMKALGPGSEQLTVESACVHLELFEVRQSAPFRRDSTSELICVKTVFAKIEFLE